MPAGSAFLFASVTFWYPYRKDTRICKIYEVQIDRLDKFGLSFVGVHFKARVLLCKDWTSIVCSTLFKSLPRFASWRTLALRSHVQTRPPLQRWEHWSLLFRHAPPSCPSWSFSREGNLFIYFYFFGIFFFSPLLVASVASVASVAPGGSWWLLRLLWLLWILWLLAPRAPRAYGSFIIYLSINLSVKHVHQVHVVH